MTSIVLKDYNDELSLERAVIPNKKKVLHFLKSQPPYAAAGGPFEDVVTGEYQSGKEFLAFKVADWKWTSSDIYHFEKYDLELKPEFIEYVLTHSN